MNHAEKIDELRRYDAAIQQNIRTSLLRHYRMRYDWQNEFIAATKTYTACMLMASNQSGKSRTGCILDSFHLTGEYPDDWKGHKFDFAPRIWCLGYSGEKTRDLLQHKMFGRLDTNKREFSGGYIPKDRILGYTAMTSVSGAAREVIVEHASGGESVCQFWSYSQGQHALMGDVVDWYHIDEEPEDAEIYPQVLTRTLNGDKGKGGRGILTFTPENGLTELVIQFTETPGEMDYMQGATWDQCAHMTKEKQENFLSKYPPYQREMRSKGTPLMGSGLIYEVSEDDIKVDPFAIPQYWFVIDGIDFGWDHPQAHVQLVWDRDSNTFYVTNAWKRSKAEPYEAWHVCKPWADGVPTAWPQDGLQHKTQSTGESTELYKLYLNEGFNMIGEPAQFEDGGNGVWVGIMEILSLMKSGNFKVFSNLFPLFEEIRQYHTKTSKSIHEPGKVNIVKIRDDLVDAMRYAYMMRRHAIRICDIHPPEFVAGEVGNMQVGEDY